MVSVFFFCSSPYVGYTLRQADYLNKEMKNVTDKEMTSVGYNLFNSSGSYMVLGSFDGRKYFHTRQTRSENYDEQGRRIYTNIAFAGDCDEDNNVIDKIAMYVMFCEQTFYSQMAEMIELTEEGFTVDFDKLKQFVEEFSRSDIVLKSNNREAVAFFEAAMKPSDKKLSFVVTESTWGYFVRQSGYDFGQSVGYVLSFDEAQALVSGGNIEFVNVGSPAPAKKEEKAPRSAKTIPNKDIGDAEKDRTIEKLKSENNSLCAQKDRLEKEVNHLQMRLSEAQKETSALKTLQKSISLKYLLSGAIGTALVALAIHIVAWIAN